MNERKLNILNSSAMLIMYSFPILLATSPERKEERILAIANTAVSIPIHMKSNPSLILRKGIKRSNDISNPFEKSC